jgi:hypothetical protein
MIHESFVRHGDYLTIRDHEDLVICALGEIDESRASVVRHGTAATLGPRESLQMLGSGMSVASVSSRPLHEVCLMNSSDEKTAFCGASLALQIP